MVHSVTKLSSKLNAMMINNSNIYVSKKEKQVNKLKQQGI